MLFECSWVFSVHFGRSWLLTGSASHEVLSGWLAEISLEMKLLANQLEKQESDEHERDSSK